VLGLSIVEGAIARAENWRVSDAHFKISWIEFWIGLTISTVDTVVTLVDCHLKLET